MKVYSQTGAPVSPSGRASYKAALGAAFDSVEAALGKFTQENAPAFQEMLAEKEAVIRAAHVFEIEVVVPKSKRAWRQLCTLLGGPVFVGWYEGELHAVVQHD